LALRQQNQWEGWLAERERLREGLRRGREYLSEVERELAELRERVEKWPTHERTCGRNPLADDLANIMAKERERDFLPGWLERREEELRAVTRKIEVCARENGLEHFGVKRTYEG
jgi:hypothetical protein